MSLSSTVQEAIQNRHSKIEVAGSDFSEALLRLEAMGAFVHAIDSVKISGWVLNIHWPEAVTGELPLGNNPPAIHSEQHETDKPSMS